jgi:hypothetical protein
MDNRAKLPLNQLYNTSNFIWKDNKLTAREGFYRFARPMSNNSVKFIDIFKKTTGQKYLMYSDGSKLWYRTNLTDTSLALNFGASNTGTVDHYAGLRTLRGNDIVNQKFRSLFGTGEGYLVKAGDTTRTNAVFLLDTMVAVTVAYTTTATVAHQILYSDIQINSALPISNNYWIYSNQGRFYFNRPDSFVIADAATALRYVMTGRPIRSCWSSTPVLKFASTTINTSDYGGKYLRYVSNPMSAGGVKNPVDTNKVFYVSYPIFNSGSPEDSVVVGCPAIYPDSTVQYFTVEDLIYDATTLYSDTVDSIQVVTPDSAGTVCSNRPARYLRLFCETCGFDDTTKFWTGDWFFAPDSATFANPIWNTIKRYTYHSYVLPVVGGVSKSVGGKKVLFVGIGLPHEGGSLQGNPFEIADGDTARVHFFRMKRSALQLSGSFIFATVYQDRVFTARDSTPNTLEWSEPFMPDSSLALSTMIINSQDGDEIRAGSTQYGDLIIYMNNSRWKVFGDGVDYGKERLNGNVGCVAPRTFLNINNEHYFLHSSGFYRATGSEAPELLSSAVNGYFLDSINGDRYDQVCAGYDEENDNIWISFPRIGSTSNNITLTLNVKTNSWWLQTFSGSAYAYNKDRFVSDSVQLIVGGKDSSQIYVRGRTLDDGAEVDAYFKTGWFDYGTPEIQKRLYEVLVNMNPTTTHDVFFHTYRDYRATAFDTVSYAATNMQLEQRLIFPSGLYHGNAFSHRLAIDNASGATIQGWKVKLRTLGEVPMKSLSGSEYSPAVSSEDVGQ